VLEFEAADTADRFAADPLAAVQEMIAGFGEAGSLQALCQLAAERVREVAQYDRVLVYRFMQDDSGWVIAESRKPELQPFLDLHYPAADIPKQARALYVKSWLRLITQVNYDPAPLLPTNNPRTGEPLDMSQAILRDVSPVHRQYLRNMGIDASMSISIIRGGKLWGLIACHHYSPRLLPRHLRAVCELFGSMFSLQLEARESGEQFGARLASRMVLQNLMLNLAGADDYAIGLTQQSPNLLDYIHGGSVAADGTRQGGVAVCVKGQLTFLGITPTRIRFESRELAGLTHDPDARHLLDGSTPGSMVARRRIHGCRFRSARDLGVAGTVQFHHVVPSRADRDGQLGGRAEEAFARRRGRRSAQPSKIL
jgi:chemotaxis family two-component system sensor kinase Cph1